MAVTAGMRGAGVRGGAGEARKSAGGGVEARTIGVMDVVVAVVGHQEPPVETVAQVVVAHEQLVLVEQEG